MPYISVIIPVYKVEKTLRRCIDSVLSQTYTDYEIILVDDGSPDNSGEICDEYAEKHENIRVIHKENGGLSSARNAGLGIARGEYVMFLDSDDYLTDDCLEVLAPHSADMIIGSIYPQMKELRFRSQRPTEDRLILRERFGEEIPVLLNENRINYVHAKLYRRQVITENGLYFEDDQLTSAEDTVFNFSFLVFAQSIYVSAKAVHYYTFNGNGLASKFYPDRYIRRQRLNDSIARSVRKGGFETEAMRRGLNWFTASGARFVINDTLAQKKINPSIRLQILDSVCKDENLLDVVQSQREDLEKDGKYKELLYLIDNGSRKLLRKKVWERRTMPLKQFQYSFMIHTKEVLRRIRNGFDAVNGKKI